MKNPKKSKVAFPELRSMLWILTGMLTILLLGLGACFLFTFYDYKGVIMIISIMLLFAAILWYQIKRASIHVLFNEQGVVSYRLGREICHLRWDEVADVGVAERLLGRVGGSIPILYFSNKPLPRSKSTSYFFYRLLYKNKKIFDLSFVTVRKQPKEARRLIALEYNEKNKAELDRYVAEWKKLRYYMDEKYSDET